MVGSDHDMVNLKDDYALTRRAIAAHILNGPLASAIAPNNLSRLRAVAEDENHPPNDHWDFIHCTFRSDDTNISLEVGAEGVNHGNATFTDEGGNEWKEYVLYYVVTWPCHGLVNLNVSLACFEFYEQVALLGVEIRTKFPGKLNRMTRTAAQVKEDDLAAQEKRVKQRIYNLVVTNCRAMRVGGERALGAKLTEDLPAGEHEVELEDRGRNKKPKRYLLSVAPGTGACLSRTA